MEFQASLVKILMWDFAMMDFEAIVIYTTFSLSRFIAVWHLSILPTFFRDASQVSISFMGITQDVYLRNQLENYSFKIIATPPSGQWVQSFRTKIMHIVWTLMWVDKSHWYLGEICKIISYLDATLLLRNLTLKNALWLIHVCNVPSYW